MNSSLLSTTKKSLAAGLFLLLNFCVGTQAKAQSFNSAMHDMQRKTFNIVSINKKSFYLVNDVTRNGCCRDVMSVQGVNANGTSLFINSVYVNPYLFYGEIKVTADKQLLVHCGTHMYGCDYGGGKSKVMKMDTTGNILWSFNYNRLMGALLPKSNGTFYLVRADSIFHYNSNAQIITKWSAALGTMIHGATSLNNGKLLVSYYNGTADRLQQLDTAGVSINDVPFGGPVKNLMQAPNGGIFGVSGGLIQKLNSGLTSVASSTAAFSNSLAVSTIYFSNDTLYAAGNGPSDEPHYYLFDTLLNLQFQSPTNLESVVPTGICLASDNTLRIITYGSSTTAYSTAHTFSGYFKKTKTDTWYGAKDVGVVNVQITSQQATPVNVMSSTPSHYAIQLQGIVTVKNFGPDTIHYFRLNTWASSGGITYCLFGLHQGYTSVLAPGATIAVPTGTFNTPLVSIASVPANGIINGTLCIYTSVPDSTNDFELRNNELCSQITVSVDITSLHEIDVASGVHIAPNPTHSELNIRAETSIGHIKLMTTAGQVVFEDYRNEPSLKIELGTLPKGIYVLQIETSNQVFTKKICLTGD